MYEIFGEFDSFEGINKAAEGLKAEGDLDNISVLAKENGIDDIYVQMFVEGDIPALCDITTAAVGKLDAELQTKEVKAYASKIPAEPIADYLKTECMKEQMAAAIRRKGKSLKGCLKHVEAEAKKKVSRDRPYLADAVVYKMAKDYYMGK